jgi:phage terminase small subunit
MSKILTAKETLFVDAYIETLEQTQAARRAGYSTPDKAGWRIFQKEHIQAAIEARRQEIKDRLGISPERVLKEYAHNAFSDPAEFFDKEGSLLHTKDMPESARRAIASVSVKKKFGGEYDDDGNKIFDDIVEVKVNNKLDALNALAKHLGLFEKDNDQKGKAMGNALAQQILAAEKDRENGGAK